MAAGTHRSVSSYESGLVAPSNPNIAHPRLTQSHTANTSNPLSIKTCCAAPPPPTPPPQRPTLTRRCMHQHLSPTEVLENAKAEGVSFLRLAVVQRTRHFRCSSRSSRGRKWHNLRHHCHRGHLARTGGRNIAKLVAVGERKFRPVARGVRGRGRAGKVRQYSRRAL